jgi:CheY-like chemotaxis protein
MTLEAIVAAPEEFRNDHGIRLSLYRYFHRIWESSPSDIASDAEWIGEDNHDPAQAYAQRYLRPITPLCRQALLLNALEGFSVDQVATIIGVDIPTVEKLLEEAIVDAERNRGTSVLIIEDEPLIALELEHIVTELGLVVADVVTTHDAAVHAFAATDASLVLADIQLGDGSSGIDAVEDILQIAPIPVIFITAYPERLLTGNRVEPSFLISKPFNQKGLRAAISQCLNFTPELAC